MRPCAASIPSTASITCTKPSRRNSSNNALSSPPASNAKESEKDTNRIRDPSEERKRHGRTAQRQRHTSSVSATPPANYAPCARAVNGKGRCKHLPYLAQQLIRRLRRALARPGPSPVPPQKKQD